MASYLPRVCRVCMSSRAALVTYYIVCMLILVEPSASTPPHSSLDESQSSHHQSNPLHTLDAHANPVPTPAFEPQANLVSTLIRGNLYVLVNSLLLPCGRLVLDVLQASTAAPSASMHHSTCIPSTYIRDSSSVGARCLVQDQLAIPSVALQCKAAPKHPLTYIVST